MKLSIIIPYYNADAYIGRMLDSLLDQDLAAGEYEIIVVDDGSEEEPTVLMDYVRRFPQIQYHRIAHAGLSPARNHGLTQAHGDWLYFCDSDDYVQRRVLGGIIGTAEAHGLEMVRARHLHLHPSDPIPEPRRNFTALSPVQTGLEYIGDPTVWFSWGVWGYLIRRSVIDAAALTFEPIFYVEDRLFMLDLFPRIRRIAFVDVDLYYYLQYDTSILHSRKRHDGPGYKSAMLEYLRRLTALIDGATAAVPVAGAAASAATIAVAPVATSTASAATIAATPVATSAATTAAAPVATSTTSAATTAVAPSASPFAMGVPSPAVARLSAIRDADAFRLIHNVLRYCSTREASECFDKLSSLGAYPLASAGTLSTWGSSFVPSFPIRLLRSLMNRRGLWLLLCRLYHLLPQDLRSRL